jgi:molecular chaperone HtpG
VKDWLRGIQQELDQSWAVLGEVYGRYGCLRDFGLTIRRIRSNLDDEQGFATSVDYVPELMRLMVSKGELLALLLEPLYGQRPEVGIRELVQNAVDAVREPIDDLNQIFSRERFVEQ